MTKPTVSAPLLALAALSCCLAACSVKAPPQTTWTIRGRTEAAARTSETGPALGVARFSAAAEVRRTDLTWRSDEGRMLHDTEDRWSDYPDRMLEEVVREALLDSGAFSSVTTVPPATGLDAILHARLTDFSEWHEGNDVDVRVALEWRLTRPGGEILAQDVIRTSSALSERSVAGSVRAYQQASDEAARLLVQAVGAAVPAP